MSANDLPIDMLEAGDGAQLPATVPPSERAALAMGSSKTEQDLLELAAKHTGITEIKDKAGREQAHGAAMELMRARTAIKKVADEAREDAKKFNAAVIAEERRLTAIVEPEETRLKGLRDAWDAEQERIKAEKAEAERQRILKITGRIQEIKGYATLATQCRTAERVQGLIDKLAAYDLSGFDEFDAEAAQAHADTLKAMGDQFRLLTEREAEAARLKAEREELARQQAEAQRQAEELAAQQKAEADRLAAERAELERMRAEIEAAKAVVVVVPSEPCVHTALIGDGAPATADVKLIQGEVGQVDSAVLIVTDAGLVDAEIRMGFDMAMSMPVLRVPDLAPEDDDGIPNAETLIAAVANSLSTDMETACQWLCMRADEFEAWVPNTTA